MEHSGDAGRIREAIAGGSLDWCNASSRLQRSLDKPLGQPCVSAPNLSQTPLAVCIETAVLANRSSIADERVVDEVSDPRLI
jgi:hypothetical protein